MKGYTLIEILVTLTIVGLLFGFGYVNFRDYSRRQAVAGAAKEIQGDLRLAQEDALAGQIPSSTDDPQSHCSGTNSLNGYDFRVLTQKASNEYEIRADCSGGDPLNPLEDVVLSTDITIAAPSINPILFKVLGQGTNIPSGQNATITLSQTGTSNATSISVSSGGEIQ